MSKSEANPGHALGVLDSPDSNRSKLSRATTDSLYEIRFNEARPGIYNLLTIFQIFSGESKPQLEARFTASYRFYEGPIKEVQNKIST
jgi:tryptophanyl-tRNA synthetase